MDTPDIALITPDHAHEIEAAREIFRDYAATLGIDLCFQHPTTNYAQLPGDYAEPRGALLLALVDSADSLSPAIEHMLQRPGGSHAHRRAVGCGRSTPDHPNAAEMKRLYVRPASSAAWGWAGNSSRPRPMRCLPGGATPVCCLDTLDDMEAARTLYEEFKFEEIPPYYHNRDCRGALPQGRLVAASVSVRGPALSG